MTQAAIAAEIHQPLDVDAGLTAKVALDEIVTVDHFADLQDFLVAQLADATIHGDLDLLDDLGRVLLADAMNVLKRDQHALVSRDIHAGNTGHGLLSCRRSLMGRLLSSCYLGQVSANANTTPFPSSASGPGIVKNYPTWMRGLLKDSTRFRQPPLSLSSLFRDLFGDLANGLFCRLFGLGGSPSLGGRGSLPGHLGGCFLAFWSGFGGLLGRFGCLFSRWLRGLLGGRSGLFGRSRRLGPLGFHRPDRRQDAVDLPGDVLDGHHAVDRQELSPLRIIVNQGLG